MLGQKAIQHAMHCAHIDLLILQLFHPVGEKLEYLEPGAESYLTLLYANYVSICSWYNFE